jgi:hypothetical protein
MADYIPVKDLEFNVWQDRLVLKLTPNITIWGILPADFAVVKEKQTNWIEAFSAASSKKNRSTPDVAAKNETRAIYEKEIRKFVAQWLSNNPKVTNSDRESMGLPLPDDSRTPAPVPSTRPAGRIDFSQRMQHVVHFKNETGTGKAKPEGVHGCEIWVKIGTEAPKIASELQFLATCTRSPYKKDFESSDAGKTAWYWLRWVNTRGEQGPWSLPVSAMIVG